MANELQEMRRSAVVYNAGPGAVVDFRDGGGAVSGVIAGLEEWDNSFPPPGLNNSQCVYEPRLQNKLRVDGFRTSPVEVNLGWSGWQSKKNLVAVRFPDWLQCPNCNFIRRAKHWGSTSGKAHKHCPECTGKAPGQHMQFVVPVRFVVACEKGHLNEFPWHLWVQHHKGCKFSEAESGTQDKPLKLKSEGHGLAGIMLSCPECKAKRSMDGIFSKDFSKRVGQCQGRRPWLADARQKCDIEVTAVQRGASNLYFPVIESALSIPPWSDRLQEILGIWWGSFICVPDYDELEKYIEIIGKSQLRKTLENDLRMSPSQLAREIWTRRQKYHQLDPNDLRAEEHRQFVGNIGASRSADDQFETRPERVSKAISPWISTVVRAVRLREVRAIRGFTRIKPPGDPDGPDVSRLSKSSLNWLPAIEVRGEGIFISLDEERMKTWEAKVDVRARAQLCTDRFNETTHAGSEQNQNSLEQLTPRYMLCHTLSHAIMRQLVIECGYSSASLQERIYSRSGDQPMSGLLLYTATTDADGTLGGLERLGRAGRIEGIIKRAVEAVEWCSSDPLCILDSMAALDNFSRSVCHSCCLAPETSCESYNRFLDRALLTGDGKNKGIGFFEDMISRD